MTLVFLHGLESGPHGSKYQALRDLDPQVLAPDCEGILDLDARLAIVERELTGLNDLVLVGSSFGGLVATLFADRHPEQVRGYLLCAPALHLGHADVVTRVPKQAHVLHGTRDDMVPIAASRRFCQRLRVPLHEVDDDHRLHASMPRLVDLAREILG
jgi:alpha-beta hydrolase superfamily lysophospholipase